MHCQWKAHPHPWKSWVQTSWTHTQTLHTWMVTNCFLIGCGWLWNKICWMRASGTLNEYVARALHNLPGLDRHHLPWPHPKMGLCQPHHQHIHARLCQKKLQRFQHITPTWPQHAPHAWIPPQYRTTTQLTNPIDESPNLDKSQPKQLYHLLESSSALDEYLIWPC